MTQFNKTDAYLEMDERVTTERILNRMTDPRLIEQRRQKREAAKRVDTVKNRLGI